MKQQRDKRCWVNTATWISKVSHTDCGTNCVSTMRLGCAGEKGQTKPLVTWALSVCVTLGKTFNLSVPQFLQL